MAATRFFWPQALHTRDPSRRPIAAVRLGLIAYLADPSHWSSVGARSVVEAALAWKQGARLQNLWTSGSPRWVQADAHDIERFLHELQSMHGPRHNLDVRLYDQPGIAMSGVRYREVRVNAASTGVLEWTFPAEMPADEIWRQVCWLADTHPLWSATVGYVVAFEPDFEVTAFNYGYTLSRRFLGIDLQHPERFARRAREGLPSVNWITVFGGPLWQLVQSRTPGEPPEGVISHDTARAGMVWRAGPRPQLGDCNLMEYPEQLAALTRHLEGCLHFEPPRFPGLFGREPDHDLTRCWQRRLLGGEW